MKPIDIKQQRNELLEAKNEISKLRSQLGLTEEEQDILNNPLHVRFKPHYWGWTDELKEVSLMCCQVVSWLPRCSLDGQTSSCPLRSS